MNATLILALLMQGIALVAVRVRLGKGWLTRPVTLLVLAAVAYHGLSEALLAIGSIRQWDLYRIGISQAFIVQADLIMSAGLLALVLGYLVTRPERSPLVAKEKGASTLRTIDWRIYAIACAPLAVLTYQGRGYYASIVGNATTQTSLASTFLILLVMLTAFGFLSRHGMRWLVVVLIIQSLLLAAAGQRTPIVVASVGLIVLLIRVGLRPTKKQIAITLSLAMITMLAITGYRAVSGRAIYYSNSGLLVRLEALGTGLYTVTHASAPGDTGPGLVTQLATRFDGDAFAGGVLQDTRRGQPELGVIPAAKSLLEVIPSSLWAEKLAHGDELNPAGTTINQFGLSNINYLPTTAGLYMAYIGPAGIIVLLAVLGFLSGLGEAWLLRRYTTARLVLLASAVEAALTYEAGLPAMLVALRAGIVLAVIEKTAQSMTRRRSDRKSLHLGGTRPNRPLIRQE